MQAKKVLVLLLTMMVMIGLLCSGAAVSAEGAVPVESADLSRKELILFPGGSFLLKYQALPVGSEMTGTTWVSDNEDVAIVSDGEVTAVAKGKATITATTPNGLKDTCVVTVVSGDVLLKNSTFLQVGQAAWSTEGDAVFEATGGRGDSACAKIGYQSTLKQTLQNLKANTTYTVTLAVLGSEKTQTTVKVVAGEKELGLGTLDVTTAWKTKSFEFSTDAALNGETLVFQNANTEGAVVYVDDVVVAEKPSAADLTVEKVDWTGGDGQVKPRTKLNFVVTVKNVGTADVTDAVDVDITFGDKKLFRLTHEGGIKAGESVTLTSKTWRAKKGDFMIAAHVNPELSVSESNEMKNNVYQTNLRVAKEAVTPTHDAVADIVSQAGMVDLTFSDDFDDLSSVDTLGSGDKGYKWYTARQWQQTDMTQEDYFVKDGVFTLQYADAKYALGATTADPDTHIGYVFNKGYLEVKLRIPTVEKVKGIPAIWSLPLERWVELPGHKHNSHWVEMDWLEYNGNGNYTITMHEQEVVPGADKNWYTSTDNFRKGLDDQEWHVMGWLWEEGHLQCFMDGEPIREQEWSKDSFPIPMHDNRSGEMRIEGVFAEMDAQNMVLYIAGSRYMPLELDYVRIWQKGAEQPSIDQPSGGVNPLVIVAAVCGVVVAAVVVIFFIRKRKPQA